MNLNDRVTFNVTGKNGEILETLTGRVIKIFKNGKIAVRTMNRWASAMKVYNVKASDTRPAVE